jgi:transposase
VIPSPAFSVLRGSSEQEISLWFVEGPNTKIRVIQRRAYGLRDEDYLRLKILACMLPEI